MYLYDVNSSDFLYLIICEYGGIGRHKNFGCVAELVYAQDLKSCGDYSMWVRLPLRPPIVITVSVSVRTDLM